MATKATVTVFLFLSLFGLNTSLYRKHYYVNIKMRWSDAQRYCRYHYDDLSTVSNEELQLLTANPQITMDYYWIGLKRSFLLSTWWMWTGGEDSTDVMWDKDQTDPDPGYCAVRRSSSKVHNADCNWAIPFYCMEVFDLILMKQECTWEEALEYCRQNNKDLAVLNSDETMTEALEYCRQNNKDLAVLNSDETMTEAKDTSAAALTDDVWIGLRFIVGRWVWANGEDLQYNGWSSGGELQCPAMNQRCAVLNHKSMTHSVIVDCVILVTALKEPAVYKVMFQFYVTIFDSLCHMAAGKHTRPTLSSGGVCNTGQKRRKGQSINWTSSGLVIGLLCRKSLESLYRWHIYVNESMTWTDAQQYCRKHHDDLSTTSAIEVKLLSANPKVTSDFFWIGLRRDSQSPLLWKWSGGENASNVQWDVTQPDTLHEQCAAVLKSNGKLHDAACFLSIPFYCMEVIELILVQKENTWIEALEYCRQNHVDLAGLTSDLMMREAKNKSAPAHADDVWIGLRFIASHWFLDGSNVDYKGWSLEGEPQCPPVDQRWFDKKRWFGNLTAVSGDSTFSVSRNIKRYKE